MRIKKIKIQNFRSIKNLEIDEIGKFNVFLGKNNHGKSNIFEAIDYLFNGNSNIENLKNKDLKNEPIIVEAECIKIEDFIEGINNDNHKKEFKKHYIENKENIIKLIRKNNIIEYSTNDEKCDTGKNNILVNLFEYIDARQHAEKEDKISKTNNLGKLFSVAIKEQTEQALNDEKFKDLKTQFDAFINERAKDFTSAIQDGVNEYLQEIIDDCKLSFNIQFNSFDDLFKNITMKANDGVETNIDEKGDGVQRAVVVSMIRYIADKSSKTSKKNTIFAIDEAELHLHAETQRKMEESLKKIARNGGQVFINTHSPIFMNNDQDKKIFKVEKINGETKIELSQNYNHILYGLLGGLPTDYLFPNNFLIVEGDSEEIFIPKIIERFYQDKPKIQIINAKGNSNLPKEKISLDLIVDKLENTVYKGKPVVLLDKLNKNDIKAKLDDKLKETCPDEERLFFLPTERIEDYYPLNLKNSSDKPNLAKYVSENITKDVFEKEMSVIYQALTKCWELAFTN